MKAEQMTTDIKGKVAFHTFGCKLNFSETSTIAREFSDEGYERVDFDQKADVYIINSCSVTDNADKKCRQAIKKIHKKSPDAFIAIVGCYAQLKSEEIAAIPGVDAVFGIKDKFNILSKIKKFEKQATAQVHSCEIEDVKRFDPAFSSGDRTRTFLKVQDGCSYKCTYCTIPKARGNSRSGSVAETIVQAEKIAALGTKEIILTGVNIGDFGRGTNEDFLDLLKGLEKVDGIDRYRISSIEPNLLKDEIIEMVAVSDKFLPHFHIPLQTGNNELLALMKRRYKRELFASKVQKIKELMPNAFIGVDVIVGFPGETEEKFLDTYQFLESLDVSFLHVFSYSTRLGTPAETMDGKVSDSVIAERSARLHSLSDYKHRRFYQSQMETTESVLFEHQQEGNAMVGFTQNYIKVEIAYDSTLANTIRKVRMETLLPNGNMHAILVG